MTPSDIKHSLHMVEVLTRELSGAALDWAVAQVEGYECQFDDEVSGPWLVPADGYLHDEKPLSSMRYSTDASLGTPLVERFRPHLNPIFYNDLPAWESWSGWELDNRSVKTDHVYGPTLLIAALRCYVSSKYGETIMVPALLLVD